MTSIHQFVGGKFFKAADIADGPEPVLKLKGFSCEQMEDGEQKVVAWFHDHKKGLVIGNVDNAQTCIKMFGGSDQIEEWSQEVDRTDTYVQLFVVQTQMGPGVRLRSAEAPSPADDDQPTLEKLTKMLAQLQGAQK